MHSMKCSYSDFTVKTVTAVILWLDVIIFGCILFVEISNAQEESCLEGNKDCSYRYRVVECLLINVVVGLIALYGVQHSKPKLMLPFIGFKYLLAITIAAILFWKYLMNGKSDSWIINLDRFDVRELCIVFGFQLYSIFIVGWNYFKTKKARTACSQKTFKSMVSIWIGDTSNLTPYSSDSTCIIEAER